MSIFSDDSVSEDIFAITPKLNKRLHKKLTDDKIMTLPKGLYDDDALDECPEACMVPSLEAEGTFLGQAILLGKCSLSEGLHQNSGTGCKCN
jgi:hypothetical protein